MFNVQCFQCSQNLFKHRQNFILSFISPVLSMVSGELQTLFWTYGVVEIDFF